MASGGGGALIGGCQNPTTMAPPPTVIKKVKYCGVKGGALGGGHQNPTKVIASVISVIKIVKYFRIVEGRKNPTK